MKKKKKPVMDSKKPTTRAKKETSSKRTAAVTSSTSTKPAVKKAAKPVTSKAALQKAVVPKVTATKKDIFARLNELRIIANEADDKVQKVLSERNKKIEAEPKNLDKICKDYDKKYNKAMEERRVAMTNYESVLESNFTVPERLKASGKRYQLSRYSKVFLNNLEKQQKQQKQQNQTESK